MTIALCTNCGELKHGALCVCPTCESAGFDDEINILLSDHILSEIELCRIGDAIRTITKTDNSEDVRFQLLLYYLARKWPKLLDYNVEAVEPELQKKMDEFYSAKLAHFSGQSDPALKVPPIRSLSWAVASGKKYQDQDDAWRAEVIDLLAEGSAIAGRIIKLQIECGEGALLQRMTHSFRTLLRGCDYCELAGKAIQLAGDTGAYSRTINSFCDRVKNGWSDRTKQQAAYFRGICHRLEEMAGQTRMIIEHKAGIKKLIPIDFKRLQQQFYQSYETCISLLNTVLDPSRIQPE